MTSHSRVPAQVADAPRRARASLARGSITRSGPLPAFGLAIAAFVLAAVAVAARNAFAPFDRGWWLAAYALLVGGVSQLLLVAGQLALARRRRREPPRGLLWGQLALWNTGAATVAVADLAEVPPLLAAGSLLLLVALGLFLAELRHPYEDTDATTGTLTRAYLMLALVLVASVIVGTALGGALPGF